MLFDTRICVFQWMFSSVLLFSNFQFEYKIWGMGCCDVGVAVEVEVIVPTMFAHFSI